MGVAERLAELRSEVPAEVAIVAVTKGRSLTDCREALAAGLTELGENRVQEALPKIEELSDARWHLIGHLQSNKARHASRFALVQSVDSLHLADAIARHAPGQPCLLQVNTSREPQKHGCSPEEAVELAGDVSKLLDLRGLMCIGPEGLDPTPSFVLLRQLRDQAQERLGRSLPILSMGMTDDWRQALAQGSSMLRLGRFLFT
jgi:PLP dependent protein